MIFEIIIDDTHVVFEAVLHPNPNPDPETPMMDTCVMTVKEEHGLKLEEVVCMVLLEDITLFMFLFLFLLWCPGIMRIISTSHYEV